MPPHQILAPLDLLTIASFKRKQISLNFFGCIHGSPGTHRFPARSNFPPEKASTQDSLVKNPWKSMTFVILMPWAVQWDPRQGRFCLKCHLTQLLDTHQCHRYLKNKSWSIVNCMLSWPLFPWKGGKSWMDARGVVLWTSTWQGTGEWKIVANW